MTPTRRDECPRLLSRPGIHRVPFPAVRHHRHVQPVASCRLDEQGWVVRSRSMGAFAVELAGVIGRMIGEMIGDGGVYVVLTDRTTQRYVQVLVTGGLVRLESVSDHWLAEAPAGRPLALPEIDALLRDRWAPGGEANWSRTFDVADRGVPVLAAGLLVAALVDVHGLRDPRDLDVDIGRAVGPGLGSGSGLGWGSGLGSSIGTGIDPLAC